MVEYVEDFTFSYCGIFLKYLKDLKYLRILL